MGFFGGWSTGRGLYGGYRVATSAQRRRAMGSRALPTSTQANCTSTDDVPTWLAASLALPGTVLPIAGALWFGIWAWQAVHHDMFSNAMWAVLSIGCILIAAAVGALAGALLALPATVVVPLVVGAIVAIVRAFRWMKARTSLRASRPPAPSGQAVDLDK